MSFPPPGEIDFASAAINYMKSGGERRYLTPLINYFGTTPLRQIKQVAVDSAADALYPNAQPASQRTAGDAQPSGLLARVSNPKNCWT